MESSNKTLAKTLLGRESADSSDDLDLFKQWNSIWVRKWSILSLCLVAMVVSSVLVMNMTPIYRAVTTMLIERKQTGLVSVEQMYIVDGTTEYMSTQHELLRSRSLAERVVRQLDLTVHPEFDPRQQAEPMFDLGGIVSRVTDMLTGSSSGSDSAEQDILETAASLDLEEMKEARIFDEVTKKLMGRINVAPQGRSQLLQIQVDMADAVMAARIANTLAQAFIESQIDANIEMSATATAWMNTRMGELRGKLKAAEDALQAYRDQENLVDGGGGISAITAAQLTSISERMIDARRQRAEMESLYHQVQSMRNAGWEKLATVPAVLGDPLIQQFRGSEAAATARVEELSKRYGARHPTMEAAQTELAAARANLRGQVEQVVASIERNYQLAMANERSLRASVETSREQIKDISRKEFRLRELEREVETNRTLYDTFLTRLKETTATSDQDTANARIVDPASVPETPIKPQKKVIVLGATVLAGLLGTALVLIQNALSNTFKTTEEIESKLNLPVLGILPLTRRKDRKDVANLFNTDQDRRFSESVRTIRTSVVLASKDESDKVLVITSSVPEEGKSSVAANLAFALGQLERVLLIDADMRRPSLARNFDFPVGAPGLANMIAGTAKFKDCIRKIEDIDVIPAGAVPPNPLELLSSERFSEIVERLRSDYDRIIIDSPPSQVVSDAQVLGSLADSLIYVVRSEHTSTDLVTRGIGQLLQNNAPVTGIILNRVDVNKARKRGYSYSGFYDYHGYSSPAAEKPASA